MTNPSASGNPQNTTQESEMPLDPLQEDLKELAKYLAEWSPLDQPLRQSTAFSFDPGILYFHDIGFGEKDGSGKLIFKEKDMTEESNDDDSTLYRGVDLAKSELIELRDFLNKKLPLTPDVLDAAADDIEARKLLADELEKDFPELATADQVRRDATEYLDGETICALRAISSAIQLGRSQAFEEAAKVAEGHIISDELADCDTAHWNNACKDIRDAILATRESE